MAYSQRNDEFNPDNFGSNLPGLATSGEADVLHSINNLLAGSLDLTDACVTPSHLRRTEQSCDTDSSNSRNMVFTSNSSMSSTEEMSPSWPTGSRNPSSWAWSCQEMNMVYTSTPKSSNTPAVEGHVMAPQDSFKDNEPILNMGTYLKHYMSPVTTPQEFYPSSNELETGMIRSSSGSLCEKMALNDPRDLLHQNPPLETMCTSSPMMAQMSSASSTTSSIHQQPPTSPFVVADLVDLKDVVEFEKKASLHHEAAASNFATYTWCGMLPPRTNRNSPYSCKVFLGGVPWDITEVGLTRAFQEYGLVSVEWPSKAGKHSQRPLSGYVYLVFDCEQSVHSLLKDCTVDTRTPYTQDYYFRMSSQRMKCKDVQVVPWVIADSNYVISTNPHLDPSKMVFVGALHGMVNAQALARIMNDLFGGVVYVGIDTDKYRYPIGSGRVAFNNQASYMKALRAAFVEIKTPKFSKKVQIDPYLENSFCQNCGCHPGPYFCREQVCFKYFCLVCWQSHHALRCMSHHQPIMRRLRGQNSTEARPDMMP